MSWRPSPSDLPHVVTPEGLSLKRQWLYNKIREFVPHEARDLVCQMPCKRPSLSSDNKMNNNLYIYISVIILYPNLPVLHMKHIMINYLSHLWGSNNTSTALDKSLFVTGNSTRAISTLVIQTASKRQRYYIRIRHKVLSNPLMLV